jgi:hypothetical protein
MNLYAGDKRRKSPRPILEGVGRPGATGLEQEDLMRKRLLRALCALSVIVSLAALAVPAEASEISFTIPFSFIVNGQTLPPGIYRVTNERTVVLVQSYSHGAAVVTNRAESRNDRAPSVVFHRYGDQYILVQAWMDGGRGRVVPTSRLERELMEAARRASATKTFERIVVPAR